MLRQIFLAAAVTVSLLGVSAAAQAPAQPRTAARPTAQGPAHARPAGHLPGVRVVNLHRAYEAELRHVKPGRISGIVYARGKAPKAPKAPKAQPDTGGTCAEPDCPLLYNNGPVQLTPHIYLLLWGPNWTSDSSQEAVASVPGELLHGPWRPAERAQGRLVHDPVAVRRQFW